MIRFALFGAGRIGAIHAGNIAASPRASLEVIVDVNESAARALAERFGARVASIDSVFADSALDAVLIASSTDTHAPLVEAAARAGKAIFCEKPLHLERARTEACLAVVHETKARLFVGFNRRFDPNFATLKQRLGEVGRVELLAITSRDPGPPPLAYVKVSGGIFRDMMIHDFDMARWLLGEEPVEVFAVGSCLVEKAIGEAGDFDTAVVTLRCASGAIAQISNSRRASYGYDQRIEAFGEKGMLQAGNVLETTLAFAGERGVVADKPLHFFLERYAAAYRAELDRFLDVVEGKAALSPSGDDGLRALILADAATESAKTGQPVPVR
jgi:myo-inositol 2-dehydrogenase / D-chiro-inositol 1-dehydrogenase